MIPARLTFVSTCATALAAVGVVILSGAGCHRTLNHPSRDAAAGDLDLSSDGDGAGGSAGPTAGVGGGAGGIGGSGGTFGGGSGGAAAGAGGAGTGGTPVSADAGPGDAGSSEGDSGNGVAYSACGWVGNLDHLTITKREPDRGRCVVLSLFGPVFQNPVTLGILLPPNWAVQQAAITPFTAAGLCAGGPAISASSGTGAVGINGSLFSGPAATVDIAVTLTFPASGGSPAFEERLTALALNARGGC